MLKIMLFKYLVLAALISASLAAPSFSIDYTNNTFVRDGKPFRYVSGSIHLYRIPRDYWHDRLEKYWAAGLNAIETYIFWNEHEPKPGVYDFDSYEKDIFAFMTLAQRIGFVVIFRAGPYICGEHEYGALPWWLMSNGIDTIVPRSSEATYMAAVERWYEVLLPKLVPFLYRNGGPIVTVQVENEYGSYFTCDHTYTGRLRDLFKKYLGNETVLFTVDPNPHCGAIDGVYATVDFGVEANVTARFELQRQYAPKGPLVNSEFYPGWLDFWGLPHQKRDTSIVVQKFEEMMEMDANVNFYMFHGGTNFGYSNGADPPFYLAQPTSYDYDAPISEAGDITQKYLALRESISKYLPLPKVPMPVNQTKAAYGKVKMIWKAPLIEAIKNMSTVCIESETPQSFEKLGQGYGFILYSTKLKNLDVHGKTLSIPGIHDRGYISIGDTPIGILHRDLDTVLKIDLQYNQDENLYIIVENMGRLNFGNDLLDTKGLVTDVTLDGEVLTGWSQCLTDNFVPNFQSTNLFEQLSQYRQADYESKNSVNFKAPAIYMAEFPVGKNMSTFLKMDKFTKGIALIGSDEKFTNLGRYWPNKGPQVTLYTPGAFLKPNSNNQIVLIEFEGSECANESECYIEFIDYPIIDSL